MEIIYKNLTEITPYARNPRNNDDAVEKVAASIRDFGWRVPIVIDKNGEIVAGHTRYKAAQLLEMESVPCVVADDLTPEQVKAFRLADNKVAEYATWDGDLLFDELDALDAFDMSEYGFVSDFGGDDFAKENVPPKDKDRKECTCPQCGFTFGVV